MKLINKILTKIYATSNSEIGEILEFAEEIFIENNQPNI